MINLTLHADLRRAGASDQIADTADELADCLRQRDAMRRDGIQVDDYDGPMGRGIFLPGDASFNPLARCRALATRLSNEGALLFSRTPALSFGDGEVVTLNPPRFTCVTCVTG